MLRLMDRYIGKQIAAATVFGVLVLSVLLVMGNLFKELRPLLVEEHASPALCLRFILSVLPFSLIYTIPWGFLVAVLLGFWPTFCRKMNLSACAWPASACCVSPCLSTPLPLSFAASVFGSISAWPQGKGRDEIRPLRGRQRKPQRHA